jgi:hypothetical protein
MEEKITTILALTAVLLIASPHAVAAEKAPLHEGLESATMLFGELRKHFRDVLVEPVARDQASRYLARLSKLLQDIASHKEDFTHELINASLPRDYASLREKAHILEDDVSKMQHALEDFFQPMPLSWKSRGGEIQKKLFLNLSGKWQRLNDIARELNMPNAVPADLVAESRQLVALTLDLKASVDALISELASPAVDNSGGKP